MFGTLVELVLISILFLAGVALAILSMTGLLRRDAAPIRASRMAINGFVLFIGASIGPILGGAITGFTELTIVLTALLALASVPLIGVAAITRNGRSPMTEADRITITGTTSPDKKELEAWQAS